MADSQIQYVSDETGQPVSVIVPIELWREIESERETAHLLRSATMKEHLLRAKSREEGIPFEEALEKLGIRPLTRLKTWRGGSRRTVRKRSESSV
jgi:antitoxin YefM